MSFNPVKIVGYLFILNLVLSLVCFVLSLNGGSWWAIYFLPMALASAITAALIFYKPMIGLFVSILVSYKGLSIIREYNSGLNLVNKNIFTDAQTLFPFLIPGIIFVVSMVLSTLILLKLIFDSKKRK